MGRPDVPVGHPHSDLSLVGILLTEHWDSNSGSPETSLSRSLILGPFGHLSLRDPHLTLLTFYQLTGVREVLLRGGGYRGPYPSRSIVVFFLFRHSSWVRRTSKKCEKDVGVDPVDVVRQT